MKSSFQIKPALCEDLHDIARIHVACWRQTYAGLVPQDYLDNMDVGQRQQKWEDQLLGKTDEKGALYVWNQRARNLVLFHLARRVIQA